MKEEEYDKIKKIVKLEEFHSISSSGDSDNSEDDWVSLDEWSISGTDA